MQENKLIIVGDYIDTNTGLRFLEDIRGNLYCYMGHEMIMPSGGGCNCSPEINISIDLAVEKDKQILQLLSENAWLWDIIAKAIKDRKEKNCSYAMNKLEQEVKDRL